MAQTRALRDYWTPHDGIIFAVRLLMLGEVCQQNDPAKSVLVVDDERTARMALTFLLNDSGYQAAAVSSAEDALERIEQGHVPAVMLVDVELPRMSGVELVERLRSSNPDVHAVLVTACSREEVETICRTRPIECVQKPVDFPELLKLIEVADAPHH